MDRDDQLRMAPLREAQPSKWPPGIRQISVEELDALGVDAKGDLYWHGKQVEVVRPLVLSLWQSWLAGGAAVSAIIIALIEAVRLARELKWLD